MSIKLDSVEAKIFKSHVDHAYLDSDGSSHYIKGGSSGTGLLYGEYSSFRSIGPIYPSSNGSYSLGGSSLYWGSLYTQSGYIGIMYDRNDTAYYVNPAGTNKVSTVLVVGDVRGNGQQLVLNAGESAAYFTGQTNEHVYINAEGGLIVSSSPDNWGSGWSGRNTVTINDAAGNSYFPGRVQAAEFFTSGKVIHTGDTDTYTEFNAANTWRVVVGGSQKVVVNSNGLSVNNGNVYSSVYYDANNTAYYINPNGPSQFNRLTLNGSGTANSATLEIDNPSSSTFNHSIEAFAANLANGESNVILVGKEGSTKNAGYLGYYWTSAGSNNNYVSLGHWAADHLFRVYGDQVLSTVTFRSNVDVQSPIFYDKNDTTYYADFNNTGTSLNVAGGATFRGGVTIDSSGGTDNYYLTMTEAGASRFTIYENSNNVYFNGWAGHTIFRPQMAGSGSFAVTQGNNQMSTAGAATFAASVSSPIFYDSNNTGYYNDPASTSNVNIIQANKVITSEINNTDIWEGDITINGDAATYYPVGWYGGSQAEVCEIEIYRNYNETAPSSWNTSTHKGGLVCKLRANFGGWGGVSYDWVLEDFRETYSTMVAWAGHFANNRAFGLKLRGGGALYHVRIKGRSVAPTVTLGTWDPGNNSTGISSTTSVDSTLLSRRNYVRGNYLYSYGDQVVHVGSTAQTKSGTLQSNVDFRAPIFYDSNDTNYYLDMSNTGLSLKTAGKIEADYFVGNNWGGEGYTIYKGYDNWNHFISIRGHARPGQSKAQAAILGGHQTSFVEYAENNSTTGWFFIGSANSTYEEIAKITKDFASFTQVRAPIFYDTNDTNYYTNPNSTSVVKYLGRKAHSEGLMVGGYNNIGASHHNTNPIFTIGSSYLPTDTSLSNMYGIGYARGDASWIPGTSGWGMYVAADGDARIFLDAQNGGVGTASASWRAPIFYDSANTARYADPGGTSVLGGISVNGTLSLNNNNINGVNHIVINDPGVGEGISWNNGNGWNVYEAPDNNTNAAGNLQFSSSGTTRRFTIGHNGDTTAHYNMRSPVFYDSANTAYFMNANGTGDSIRVAGDVVAFYSSDIRYKDNVKPIENAIDKVEAIRGVTFEWNEDSHKETGKKDVGVIAQEIEEVLPELVTTRDNGYKAVDYPKLTALLIEAVKDLKGEIEDLKKQIK